VKSSLRHDFLRITFTLGITRTWGLIDARVSCQVFVVIFTLQKLLIDKTRNDELSQTKLKSDLRKLIAPYPRLAPLL
jgi:hypothetical protein